MLKVLRLNVNLRYYSIKHATKKPIKYTSTINLPKTKFPNRLSAAKRDEIERQLLESTFASAYRYQELHNKEPTFVLHDGPPYANGDLHMGHAVNKILKDITLRQYVTCGQKVHYIPGWDCHGLPIELKAMASSAASSNSNSDALSIRKKSRQFALDAIERQKSEFRSWGILSDWSNPEHRYLTFDPAVITNQLLLFLNFYERGLVYRDLKPVYWSPSSRTALAEAELEYDANFISPSVYVRFALNNVSNTFPTSNQNVYALVWTTTPWTLPSNQAICYNNELEYSLVKLHMNDENSSNDLYLIATNLIKDFENSSKIKCDIVDKINGSELSDCTYKHPIFCAHKSMPFYAAPHVQDTKGTGLVHTAPAHGPEDFLVSLENKMPVQSFVNEAGVYTTDAPDFLCGKVVLEEGDRLVLQHIASDVVYASTLTHSCPIDWRTKKPVIIRASEQWFINTEQLKDRAVDEITKIEIYPRVNAEINKRSLMTQVRKRPYWCISRQRAWGVPIPVFYEKSTGKVLTNNKIIAHICDIIKKEGNIDFWWSLPTEELLPAALLQELNLKAADIVKGSDIFDIWFDSGSTWSSVLKGDQIANLYLEGYDQFTGWFQSSLLTSIAARDCSPYRSLFVHGFTVDEKGHKMSKSLGNVISPKDITKKYGVDVLRLWVASHGTQHMSITVSNNLLQQAAENLSKIRATLRYLNGVIGEKSVVQHSTNVQAQTYLNKYLLSNLVDFEMEIQNYYNCYEYNRIVTSVQNFVSNQISAIYVHLIKDRLYCGDNGHMENIRFTLTKCYEVLCKSLWPIVPFLVEESWSYYELNSGFHQQQVHANRDWKDEHVENVVKTTLEVKRLINQQTNDINSWTLNVIIGCSNSEKLKLLQCLQPDINVPVTDSELCEILQVGSIILDHSTKADEFTFEVKSMDINLCPRCRRFAVDSSNDEDSTCVRCKNVLNKK